MVEFAGIRVDQRVLVLRPGHAAADRDVLRRLHVDRDACSFASCGRRRLNHLIGARRPLAIGFRAMNQAAVVQRRSFRLRRSANRPRPPPGPSGWSRSTPPSGLHRRKEMLWGRLGDRDDHPGVLLRKETLGMITYK